MIILVINSGSSTVKFQVIEVTDVSGDLRQQQKVARGLVDRIGAAASYRFEAQGVSADSDSTPVGDHEEAVQLIIHWLRSNIVAERSERRRPSRGSRWRSIQSPVLVDDGVVRRIEALSELAPLHNPAAVSGIRAAQKILGPEMPMVAAFDTSFHRTIPDKAALYAIPYELSAKYGIRRYGFHGLAHQYSLLRYGELTGVSPDKANIVTLHLGNGCSACAIRAGQSMDTSMGFTPLEGLVMGTRSGDLDPALVSYLAQKEGVTANEVVDRWLNGRSGLLGLSGLSHDMRELTAAYESNPQARLAIDVFCYRARKYLGGYLAALGGADAVVFSGGIGENSPLVREKICAGMEWCGLKLDIRLNATAPQYDWRISAEDAKLKVYVVHTDEEGIIARETARLCAK